MSQFQLSSLSLTYGDYSNFILNDLSYADYAAECVGTNIALVERAKAQFAVTAAELVAPAFKLAIAGAADPIASVPTTAFWPLRRESNGIDLVYSFSDKAYQAIEDAAALFSLPVNGVDTGEASRARAFVIGFGKAALYSALDSAARHHTFKSAKSNPNGTFVLDLNDHAFAGFSNVSVGGHKPTLNVDADVNSAWDGVLAPPINRVRLVTFDVNPMLNAESASSITETSTMTDLVDHMQSGPYRVKQKPHLLLSTVRIFLHAIGLMPSSTVSELRRVLAACVGGQGTLQEMVTDRSEAYGATNRLPPLFKKMTTKGEVCMQILQDDHCRHTPLGEGQRNEREVRWSLWVKYLNDIETDAGNLPLIEWMHPEH